MYATQRTTKYARIATASIAIALMAIAAAPAASADCIGPGDPPSWWPDGSCGTSYTPPDSSTDDWYICVSDNPGDCI